MMIGSMAYVFPIQSFRTRVLSLMHNDVYKFLMLLSVERIGPHRECGGH